MADFKGLIQQSYPLPYPTTSFAGKVVLITGASAGLGKEAARHFVRLNAAKVILGVRNLSKGSLAKKSIEETTGRLNVVELWHVELSSFESVLRFIERANKLQRLDVVLLNAALYATSYRISEDGWEQSLQVNVLSTALLGLRLLPKLIASSKAHPEDSPRLTVVSSDTHMWNQFPERKLNNIFDTLNTREHFNADVHARYPLTKLLDIFVARELAKLVPLVNGRPAVIVNSLNPGLCHSELGREVGWWLAVLKFVFARSTENGSRTLVDAALQGVESHGEYLSTCQVVT
jgi:retinol dehydrogenase 12